MKNKLIIIGAIIIAVVGSIVFWQFQNKQKVKEEAKIAAETNPNVPGINGALITEAKSKLRPIAVVVENHINSRPQSGLTDADIVYETLAEGGITRFLALYQGRDPKEIGPIRSARPYFNFLTNQWGAAYVHVGGSAIALSEINAGVHKKLSDVDQFFNGDYFYRAKDRTAPHNAYTNLELLRSLLSKKGWDEWTSVKFAEFAVTPTDQLQPTTTEITAKFFDANYTTVFTYDPTTNSYKRTNGGKPAIDKNNNLQISPMNVLVQFVEDYSVPLETTTGLGLRLEKGGRVVLFSNGTSTNGSWQYSSGVTSYTTAENKPLTFVAGQTWIILMPKSLTNYVTWK
jgi:hypothetical protein